MWNSVIAPAATLLLALVALVAGQSMHAAAEDAAVPQLVGTWVGKTDTIGPQKGLRTRDRTVHITEQTDRRFKGYFDYEDGHKDIYGVIFLDNVSFAWVTTTSKGYSHGRILGADHIASCYVESGDQATAGCSDLKRTATKNE